MKYKKMLIVIVLAIIFILIPYPASDLYIRFHFDQINGDSLQLFYSTDSNNFFSQEQSITASIDKENKQVTFCLDKSLYNHLTNIRIDFTPIEDLIGIKSVSLSSAGVVQKEYNPVVFFNESHISDTHEIEMSLVKPRNRTYIATHDNDPYIILTPAFTSQINDHFSHYRLTKFFICLFAFACYALAKRNIFGTAKESN